MKYKISAIYGNAHIRPNHKEGWRTGVYVVHPDGSKTYIPDGSTSDSNRRVTEVLDNWNLI